ncbi:hypothetical protein [Clostridium diolis]|uniref:hypothetical protein n=1 Tax=Clostridium diolis TaxID=223919 RepID=UPI003AF6D328
MEEALKFLKSNFDYLYPGFISIWIFYYIRGKNLKESSNTIVKAIVISYLYINSLPIMSSVYLYIINKYKFNDNFNLNTEIWLLIISILTPFFINKMISFRIIGSILKTLDIHTAVYSNPLDELRNRSNKNYYLGRISKRVLSSRHLKNLIKWILNKLNLMSFSKNMWNKLKIYKKTIRDERKKKAIALSIYLDGSGIMYYGWLKFHESDKDNEQKICLNKYIRYKLNDSKEYRIDADYRDDEKRYIIIENKNITRIELALQKDI